MPYHDDIQYYNRPSQYQQSLQDEYVTSKPNVYYHVQQAAAVPSPQLQPHKPIIYTTTSLPIIRITSTASTLQNYQHQTSNNQRGLIKYKEEQQVKDIN